MVLCQQRCGPLAAEALCSRSQSRLLCPSLSTASDRAQRHHQKPPLHACGFRRKRHVDACVHDESAAAQTSHPSAEVRSHHSMRQLRRHAVLCRASQRPNQQTDQQSSDSHQPTDPSPEPTGTDRQPVSEAEAAAIVDRLSEALAPSPPEAELFATPSLFGPDDKEQSRQYRRTVFDFERWREHRSTARYGRHISGILSSRIVRGLSGPLWLMAALSAMVGYYESLIEAGQLPAFFTSLSVINTEPFNLSSFALSLLLVFRTNSSYSRWEEARKIWGGVVNRSRDLIRQANSWVPEGESELLELMQRWVIAYSLALQVHIREDGDLDRELQGILLPEELERLKATGHRPNYAITVLSCAIEAAEVPDSARVRMDENLSFFADSVGHCERILKTPIPLTYTRHTSRFLVIWLAFLPFTLWHACGWGTIPTSVAIAFLLLGIEEIGVQIEEPFAILPLENMCATIARDCRDMVAQRHEVRTLIMERARPMYKGGAGPTDARPQHEKQATQRRVDPDEQAREQDDAIGPASSNGMLPD